MPDLRQNPVTGRWVVVAPTRSSRPVERGPTGGARREPGRKRAARDPDCPFCPGNEAELPEIHWELPATGEPGWRCRAVTNRYPAFSVPSGPRGAAPEPRVLRETPDGPVTPGKSCPAVGRQEVLIESPRHDRDPADMSAEELRSIVELYRERVVAVVREAPELVPSLFRNRGPEAGASLGHPHSQLVATRVTGPARSVRQERMARYRSETGDCLLCRLPELEPEGEERLVEEDGFHRAYVPWAPERPLEVWLLPKRHRASFADAEPEEVSSLAAMLGRTVNRIRILSGGADYNYMFETSSGALNGDPALHWFLRVRPVTARMAGFELDAGIVINPASPGDDARRLRGTEAKEIPNPGGEA